MKKVWCVEMDLLKHFLEFCRVHHLRCWVDGGTLLGAVRHHGFIPWDDDIDLCMPREDYDRMVKLAPAYFKPPYLLQCAYTDVDYYYGQAQFRNGDTAGIRPSDSFQPYNLGIFIDIFVLDGVPDDAEKLKDVLKRTRKIYRFLKAKNTHILASGRLGLVFRKWKCQRAVKRRGWTAIYQEAEDLLRATSWDDTERVAELSFSGDDIIFDKHIFDETVWLDFEDIQVPAPAGYDKLLRTQYGANYMTPLKAPSYHGEVIFDTERSYREVLPEVRKQYVGSAFSRLWSKLTGKKK